jgi:hypothetical protein
MLTGESRSSTDKEHVVDRQSAAIRTQSEPLPTTGHDEQDNLIESASTFTLFFEVFAH